MKKLLQLLNEYLWQSEIVAIDQEIEWGRDIFFENEDWFHAEEAEIISKKFWFIERLVENDKIILQKGIIRRVEYDNYWVLEDIHRYSAYESILMYLAIQDDPIEFLISILK